MGVPNGESLIMPGDSAGLDSMEGLLSTELAPPLVVRNGEAGASSSASMSSGGNRSLVISARRLSSQHQANERPRVYFHQLHLKKILTLG